jgi:cobalt-precorrin 5A hydrolase/precorrin-3B C17-methyltransferase
MFLEEKFCSKMMKLFRLTTLLLHLVPKQIIKKESEAVTISIAISSVEYTDKIGALWLVGMGPGDLAQITPAAKTAILQADVIIGYSLYLDLIRPLKRAGQILESFPITKERQRCQRAIQLAQWGLKVAVISSGDCGIYGMAGLVLEELQKRHWDGISPTVEVFPGITALQAAAAKVGAPLMHDFCAISLSDLLTPQEKILKRLEASAQADFVTALYNPKSQKRIELIETAQRIFLENRDPQTPVVLVRSVYRTDEKITITTLEKMLDFPIDMLTVLLIGNSTTYYEGGFVITPRGY